MAAIVRCVIPPGIGIARVGNSPDEYYIAPEAPGQTSQPAGGFKDAAGRVKRQAARFRVYGLEASGNVVGQVTPDVGQITWRVHLANRKAAWYQFLNAMDLGAKYAKTAGRRNSVVAGTKRMVAALGQGIHAAAAVLEHLAGRADALPDHARLVDRAFARYLALLHDRYRSERRWSDAPFWRRRHHPAFA